MAEEVGSVSDPLPFSHFPLGLALSVASGAGIVSDLCSPVASSGGEKHSEDGMSRNQELVSGVLPGRRLCLLPAFQLLPQGIPGCAGARNPRRPIPALLQLESGCSAVHRSPGFGVLEGPRGVVERWHGAAGLATGLQPRSGLAL